MPNSILYFDTLAEMQAAQVAAGAVALIVGRANATDGEGGFYRFDSAMSGTEDVTFGTQLISTRTAAGRWVRIFQRTKTLPHGILVMNGGVKTFYAPGVTNSAGEVTLNLTTDNTPTGPAIFTEIWFNAARAMAPAESVSNAVQNYVKNQTANLKSTTHGFYRANALNLVLGLLYNPFASTGAGVPVQFRVEGI